MDRSLPTGRRMREEGVAAAVEKWWRLCCVLSIVAVLGRVSLCIPRSYFSAICMPKSLG